jgi:uncharacterized protein YdhG (YjbR/CyaY superfamily)
LPAAIRHPLKKKPVKKKNATHKTVNEYLAAVPEPARSTLKKIRAMIRTAAPAETTEIISYGMPMYKYNGMLIGFAAYPKHCSLFLSTPSLVKMFKDELSRYEILRGTIRFPTDKPLPASLVKKIVKARVAQDDRKKTR